MLLRRFLTGEFSWRNEPKFRAYIGVFFIATVLITVDLATSTPFAFSTAYEALTHASFQAASILTTTGFGRRLCGDDAHGPTGFGQAGRDSG